MRLRMQKSVIIVFGLLLIYFVGYEFTRYRYGYYSFLGKVHFPLRVFEDHLYRMRILKLVPGVWSSPKNNIRVNLSDSECEVADLSDQGKIVYRGEWYSRVNLIDVTPPPYWSCPMVQISLRSGIESKQFVVRGDGSRLVILEVDEWNAMNQSIIGEYTRGNSSQEDLKRD